MAISIHKQSQNALEKIGVDADTYLTLKSSIFPGAKDESIAMAISYCRAAKLDIMQKPVHIVPMSVKNSQGKYEYRDTIMPGITLYRIQAARSGHCAGIDEPEFGPTVRTKIGGIEVSYPEWCKITVKKLVDGRVCEFSAKEIWTENFASTKEGKPNAMWSKRPFGQLAKCAESQAWRKAFPELFGGIYTAEEMEGKHESKHISGEIINQPTPSNLDEDITAEQVNEIRGKLELAQKDEMAILNHLQIGCLEELKVKNFLSIVRQLDKEIAKAKKSELEINKIFDEQPSEGMTIDDLD